MRHRESVELQSSRYGTQSLSSGALERAWSRFVDTATTEHIETKVQTFNVHLRKRLPQSRNRRSELKNPCPSITSFFCDHCHRRLQLPTTSTQHHTSQSTNNTRRRLQRLQYSAIIRYSSHSL